MGSAQRNPFSSKMTKRYDIFLFSFFLVQITGKLPPFKENMMKAKRERKRRREEEREASRKLASPAGLVK